MENHEKDGEKSKILHFSNKEDKNDDVDELLACFHKDNIKKFHTGKIKSLVYPISRSIAHKQNIPHIIARLYCFNIESDLLVQRRSFSKKAHPGLFTDTASGHIRYSKDFNYEHIQEEAERELEEEMGTSILYLRLLDIHLEFAYKILYPER